MNTLLVEKSGPIATIWLNRPEVRNAFNERVIGELSEIFAELPHDPETRVVILGGQGKVFSAGADLNWMRSLVDANEEQNYADSRALADLLSLINSCPQVTIARVQGAALGGGMGLASVCDIVVASQDAKFGFTEVRLGLIPAIISSFVIRKIGHSWARRYFVTGEMFDARRAREMGLVHELVSESELDAMTQAIAKNALAAAPKAVAESKSLITRVTAAPSGDLLKETSEWIARVRVGEEGQEGMAAFLEKRKPKWS